MELEKAKKAVEEAIKNSKPRKFTQTVEVAINFKDIDFKDPSKRINVQVTLPNPIEKEKKVLLFVKDKNFASLVKDKVDKIIYEEEIPNYSKKDVRRLAKEYAIFLAEASVMPTVGRYMGQILAPRGKMPTPVPPNPQAFSSIVERIKKTVVFSNKKGKNMPVVHGPIGTEKMDPSKIAENLLTVYNAVLNVLPNREYNIKSVYVKTTMGPSVKVEHR